MAIEGEIKCLYNQAYQEWKEHPNSASFVVLQKALGLVFDKRIELCGLANRAADLYIVAMRDSMAAARIFELAAHNYEFDLKTGGAQTGAGITKALHDIAEDHYKEAQRNCAEAQKLFELHRDTQDSFAKLTSDVLTLEQLDEALKRL